MWLDWLVFCDYDFNVSALGCLSQHRPSYLGFSYLGLGVSLNGCSSTAQPLLLTLDEWYLLMPAPHDPGHGVAPFGPPAPAQPLLLGHGVAPPGRSPWPWKKEESSRKTSISALLTMPKPLTVWITINCGKFWKRWEYQTIWPASWETYMQVRKQQLELDMEQQTGSK